MKWFILLGAAYVFFLAKAPRVCDVETHQQCTKEEEQRIYYLETKSRDELILLLEMEKAEKELATEQIVENLLHIKNEVKKMQQQIKILNTLYRAEVDTYNERLLNIANDYKSDLTRRVLLARGKNVNDRNRLAESHEEVVHLSSQ